MIDTTLTQPEHPMTDTTLTQQPPQRDLLSRCLSLISTLEGEDTTEQGMLDDLQRDIKQAMGITPLVLGTLI